MELLLPIKKNSKVTFNKSFTFQYGATATLIRNLDNKLLKIFTFQYGATATI